MKPKKSRVRESISPKTSLENLKVGELEYVELFNTVLQSFLGDWGFQCIEALDELPPFLKSLETFIHDARDHNDVDSYYRLVSVRDLLRKLEFPHKNFRETAQDAALHTWLDSEAACKEVNERCWDVYQHPFTTPHAELASVLSSVGEEIYSLVGDMPPDLDDIAADLMPGPGATLSHNRDEGQPVFKLLGYSAFEWMSDEIMFLSKNTLFRELLTHDPACLATWTFSTMPDSGSICFGDYSSYQTVPKTIFTDRSIEIGPSLATLFQKGYDAHLRRLLRSHWGINLRDQTPNQVLAFRGSIPGLYSDELRPCTIDMSSASDRIPYGVIASVFPPSWVRTLSRYRAKFTRLPDDSTFRNEKFSSMGNALTFSLQTILFAAVVRSVLRDLGCSAAEWRVYGDDIIVPSVAYNETVKRLQLLGGVVNVEKSFNKGDFRESCGADYLNGTAVRPFFIKKPIKTFADVYKYLNLIQTYATCGPIPAVTYAPLYRLLLSWVPKQLRLFGETHCDPSSCIWVPYRCTDKFVLSVKKRIHSVPDKLGLIRALWMGEGNPREDLGEFEPPTYRCNGALVVRRAGPRIGKPALDALARERMLDPLLLG